MVSVIDSFSFSRDHPCLHNSTRQPIAEALKNVNHGQIAKGRLGLKTWLNATIEAIPKNVPPTSKSIFALCHMRALKAVQQPNVIARKIAPKNLTANGLTAHGQRLMLMSGYT